MLSYFPPSIKLVQSLRVLEIESIFTKGLFSFELVNESVGVT